MQKPNQKILHSVQLLTFSKMFSDIQSFENGRFQIAC